MKHFQFENRIKNYSKELLEEQITEEKIYDTIQKSKQAFSDYEATHVLSYIEFLYQQGRYIKKRWWLFQGSLLVLLWFILLTINDSFYIKRSMGILVPLFVMLIVPELWKNRSSSSMEIECTVYYSLRQIYSARMLLFAMMDLLLLSAFFMAVFLSKRFTTNEFLIDFLIPFNVTCCICFRTLCSIKIGSEYLTLLLCTIWTALWLSILLNEHIYQTVVLPIWGGLLLLSCFYLVYCIRKTQKNCELIWEVNPSWN